jgi:predicted helicase
MTKLTPRPDQRTAAKAARDAFERGDRATIIRACGTGKTFIAQQIGQRMRSKTVIVCEPSLGLAAQTARAWAEQYEDQAVFGFFCADDTVAEDIVAPDAAAMRTPKEAAAFLGGPKDKVKVLVSTYHSARLLVGNDVPPADFGFFDECHHAAGDVGNFAAVLDPNFPVRKRLYMSALHRTLCIGSSPAIRASR